MLPSLRGQNITVTDSEFERYVYPRAWGISHQACLCCAVQYRACRWQLVMDMRLDEFGLTLLTFGVGHYHSSEIRFGTDILPGERR